MLGSSPSKAKGEMQVTYAKVPRRLGANTTLPSVGVFLLDGSLRWHDGTWGPRPKLARFPAILYKAGPVFR
jgi:hypothetical protein